MSDSVEIRPPVEFFGSDTSNAMGVTADFRPQPIITEFDGDGRDDSPPTPADQGDQGGTVNPDDGQDDDQDGPDGDPDTTDDPDADQDDPDGTDDPDSTDDSPKHPPMKDDEEDVELPPSRPQSKKASKSRSNSSS